MADERDLAAMTVAELDDLAEANDVAEFPWSGNKSEKIAALTAAGLGAPPAEEFSFRLKADAFEDDDDEPFGAFMAGGKAIELRGDDVYTTDDPQIAAGIRDLPFLEGAD